MFQRVLNSALSMKETIDDRASSNIKNAQVKQHRDYKSHHQLLCTQKNIDGKVLLQNQKHKDKKFKIYM